MGLFLVKRIYTPFFLVSDANNGESSHVAGGREYKENHCTSLSILLYTKKKRLEKVLKEKKNEQ